MYLQSSQLKSKHDEVKISNPITTEIKDFTGSLYARIALLESVLAELQTFIELLLGNPTTIFLSFPCIDFYKYLYTHI